MWKILTPSSLVMMNVMGVAAGCLLFSALTVTSPIFVSVSGWISSILSCGRVLRRRFVLAGSAMTRQLLVLRVSAISRWSRWS